MIDGCSLHQSSTTAATGTSRQRLKPLRDTSQVQEQRKCVGVNLDVSVVAVHSHKPATIHRGRAVYPALVRTERVRELACLYVLWPLSRKLLCLSPAARAIRKPCAKMWLTSVLVERRALVLQQEGAAGGGNGRAVHDNVGQVGA